jgi:hypothetical protein
MLGKEVLQSKDASEDFLFTRNQHKYAHKMGDEVLFDKECQEGFFILEHAERTTTSSLTMKC